MTNTIQIRTPAAFGKVEHVAALTKLADETAELETIPDQVHASLHSLLRIIAPTPEPTMHDLHPRDRLRVTSHTARIVQSIALYGDLGRVAWRLYLSGGLSQKTPPAELTSRSNRERTQILYCLRAIAQAVAEVPHLRLDLIEHVRSQLGE